MYELLIYTRSIEIIISLLTGSFLCWLGYRLLPLGLPDKSDLELTWGKMKINILKASPGIFFSLFGSTIIIFALLNNVKYEENKQYSDGTKNKIFFEKGIEYNAMLKTKFDIALKLHFENELDDAEKIYLTILDSLKIIGQVSNNLADIYFKKDDLNRAEIYAKFASSTYPDSVAFLNTLQEIKEKE